jgi:SOS-response transcriptional repressor LexA
MNVLASKKYVQKSFFGITICLMDFYDRVKYLVKTRNTTIRSVVEVAGLSLNTYDTMKKRGNLPRAEEAVVIARELGTSVEFLVTGSENTSNIPNATKGLIIRDDRGRERVVDGDLCLLPILSQKIAAGQGQAVLEDVEVVGELPFFRRMLRGGKPCGARALEVRGDSMTGVNLFDGDIVIFVPGEIRGDGIYVLKVGDEMVVKRVEFDNLKGRIHIISENPKYHERVESLDGQLISVVGKVYGWVHAHPY